MAAYSGPLRLNHVAYMTWDTAATVRFYTEVLGLPLVMHAQDDKVASTGEDYTFLHTFFGMGDGSCIAFFEVEGVPREEPSTVIPRWVRHLAMTVGTLEELADAHRRLLDAGIEVLGPVDHLGVWTSLHFFDPINDIRLELTHQNRVPTEEEVRQAHEAVARWTASHQAPVA